MRAFTRRRRMRLIVRAVPTAGRLARMSPDEPFADDARPRRSPPSCDRCGGETRFAGGESTHDLYAERFVCSNCGAETFRSFGRGSVS